MEKHHTTTTTQSQIEALYRRNVHFVLARDKADARGKVKTPLESAWEKRGPTLQDALCHAARGGLLGFIPGRSGVLVVDFDKFLTVDALTPVQSARGLAERLGVHPLAAVKTQRGVHLYFRKGDGEIGNRAWSLDGFSGDVRGDNGYVIAWDIGALAGVLDQLPSAKAVDAGVFPKPPKAPAGKRFVASWEIGNRTDTLNALVFTGAMQGQTDFSELRKRAIDAGLPAAKVDAAIKRTIADAEAKTFQRKDASTLEEILKRLGWMVRYNQRAMRCDWSLDAGATWGSTTDRTEKKLRRIIAETFAYRTVREGQKVVRPLVYGRDAWEEHQGAILADHEVDPFKLWLEKLPSWDGKKRLHRLLADTFKAEDNPLTRWASTALLLGPVQRAYEAGCKLDESVVLIGAQGIGKSSLLSNLLPASEPDWFSDSLSMTDNQQKRVESLQGRVLVEMSDLQGFTKADMQSMKSFLSRRDDGSVRLSFRRNPETMLRRCVLVGTSDRVECLPNDSAGNRRFVPVECKEGCNVETFMAEFREPLWAEALAIYKSGEVRANLPRNLMQPQKNRAESHRRSDETVEDAVAMVEEDGPLTLRQIFARVCPASSAGDRRAESRLADALRVAGWQKKRERTADGGLAYLWRKAS